MISILLPVHNDEKYLGFCLESIKDQTYRDFVCYVGFNGTVDKSKEIFSSLVSEDQRFIPIDYGLESGKSNTLNKMFKLVETERVCLIDGDDIWHKEKLEKQVRLLYRDIDIIGTLTTYIDENNTKSITIPLCEFSEEISRMNLSGMNQIINSSCMIKRSCIDEVNGWDPEVEGLEDFDMWVKFSLSNKKFYNIQEPLVFHRVHSQSNFNAKTLKYSPTDIIKKNLQTL